MKYTREQFDNLPVVNGRKQCPTGDYSAISNFGEYCNFGRGCSFENCNFGGNCIFGRGCSFENCSFGENCNFGEYCIFGRGCIFGEYCNFGRDCSFGEYCSFGRGCGFGEYCSFENMGKGSEILQIRCGSAMRTSTAFNLDTGIYIRSGCFLGTLEEFKAKVMETHGNNKHAKAYLLWCEIIETYWL